MKLTVNRFHETKEETIGRLSIDGKFECFTLEDQHRDLKVKGDTRIPAGTYEIKLRNMGGHHARYAAKFPAFHKGMLWLQNVPGFEFILIHIGNTDKDTEGCLLVGKGWTEKQQRASVIASTSAYADMYQKVVKAFAKNEKVTIEIK